MAIVKFEEGDVVQLRSGGPSMTVAKRPVEAELPEGLSKDAILCIWFSPAQKLERMWFEKPMLMQAK